jgi:hypothetical protein
MTTREERLAANEAMFREANERMIAWPENREWARLNVLCECGDRDCRERVSITGAQYEAVRADAARFVVLPGHTFPEVERVVQEESGYVVVEKDDDVRPIVEQTDARPDAQPG